MVPDTSMQKAVLLLGDGGNGKSTYLRAVTAFVGRLNVSSLPLHRLEADKFSVARLMGKLANIAADLPSEHLSGTSTFKALTGGDEMTGERKFEESFDFIPFARLVFSANQPPKSGDSSQGFYDRWVVVPFMRTFRGTGAEIDRKVLDARLGDPSELSGVLNHTLDALDRLWRTHRFTDAESLRAAAAEFRETTDPLAVWLDRATLAGPDLFVLKHALFHAYDISARKEGLMVGSANMFGRTLKKLRPGVVEAQRSVAGKVQWVWLGIGLRADEEPGCDSGGGGDGSRDSRDSRDFPIAGYPIARPSDDRCDGELENEDPGYAEDAKTRESRESSEADAPESADSDVETF